MSPETLDLRAHFDTNWRQPDLEELLLRIDCRQPIDDIAADMRRPRIVIINKMGSLRKAGLILT